MDSPSKSLWSFVSPYHLFSDYRGFTCSQCQVDFTIREDLLIHKASVHPPEHFVCDICKTTFRMKSQLRKHIAGHAPSGKVEKLRICQLCPATFPLSRGSRQVFNDHMRVVHNECISYRKRAPAFHLCTCHLCGKIFRHKRLLTNHMKVHNTDKSFECDNCDAKFTQSKLVKNRNFAILHKVSCWQCWYLFIAYVFNFDPLKNLRASIGH